MSHALETFHNILVVRTDRVGDVILTTPLISALRKAFPEARVSALVRDYTAPLLEHNDDIHDILVDSGQPLRNLVRIVKEGNFDLAIVAWPSWRTVMAVRLAGIPIRVGPLSKWYSLFLNRRVRQRRSQGGRHEAQYNLDLIGLLPEAAPSSYRLEDHSPKLVLTPLEIQDAGEAAAKLGLQTAEPWVVVHPGSGGSSARWRLDRFAGLIDGLLDAHYQVLVTAGTTEEELITRLKTLVKGNPVYLAPGSLALRELAALLFSARLFVGNSTGPLHIAAALRVPTISFYTGTRTCSAKRWGPVGEEHQVFESAPVMVHGKEELDYPEVGAALEACLAQLERHRPKPA